MAANAAAAMSTSATSDARAIDDATRPTPAHAARVFCRELGRVRAGSAAGVARDPQDHGTGEQEQEPRVAVRPQRDAREEYGPRDGEEAEADQRPRPVSAVAECRGDDRVLLPLVGHDERRGGVDEDARAAQEGEDDEADAEDGGVDLEVACEAAADAGNHAVRATALQAADLGDLGDIGGVCVHVSRMTAGARRRPSGMTLSRPRERPRAPGGRAPSCTSSSSRCARAARRQRDGGELGRALTSPPSRAAREERLQERRGGPGRAHVSRVGGRRRQAGAGWRDDRARRDGIAPAVTNG